MSICKQCIHKDDPSWNNIICLSCRIGSAPKSVIKLLPASAAQLLNRVNKAFQMMLMTGPPSKPADEKDIMVLGDLALQFTSVAFKVKEPDSTVHP